MRQDLIYIWINFNSTDKRYGLLVERLDSNTIRVRDMVNDKLYDVLLDWTVGTMSAEEFNGIGAEER